MLKTKQRKKNNLIERDKYEKSGFNWSDFFFSLYKNMSTKKKSFKARFEKISSGITRAVGTSTAFTIALFVIVIWAITGPIFRFSDTWQLVINTGTTIITFLMVFVIQQSQNKDSLALQLKLNELIASDEKASNRLIVVENLTQDELEVLKKFYVKLSELAKKENDLHTSHSVDEADDIHAYKISSKKARISVHHKHTTK
jgi:low affinity Fe/Cu permease